ncbi:MAG: hypothetical protein ACI8QS_001021 [Planctomycetota bacterium]|jgi:hypothetical protein
MNNTRDGASLKTALVRALLLGAGLISPIACGGNVQPAVTEDVGVGPLRAYPPVVALKPAELDPAGFWGASGKGDGLWASTPTVSPEAAAGSLQAIGYAQGFEVLPVESGVFVRVADRIQPGPNLYVSGHGAEAILMATDGAVLHRWSHAYEALPNAPEATEEQAGCWRRAAAREDGRLYAIHEGVGLVALDRDSNLLWFHAGGEHHDLVLLDDGGLIVLARAPRVVPEIHAEYPVLEDFVLWLDANGNELRRISLLEAWRRSDFSDLLGQRPYLVGDIMHTNGMSLLGSSLEARLPAFTEGNLLLSARMLDAIFVLDPSSGRVVWAQRRPWLRQHDPSLTEAGTVLLFDNRGYRGASQVLEFDPAASREIWSYRGIPPQSFDSIFLGAAQRLANGNTLITEGCAGRALEVTPAGEVVWEFISGHRAGEDGELVAALFDVVRMPVGFGENW